MFKKYRIMLVAILTMFALLMISGCTGPAATENQTASPIPTANPHLKMKPEQVVVLFWKDLDNGSYVDAYDLVYKENNVSSQEWVLDHENRYGPNGENLRIYQFDIKESFPVEAEIFEGNFSDAQAVTVDTIVSYFGTNTTSTTQFAVVNTNEGWKLYGPY